MNLLLNKERQAAITYNVSSICDAAHETDLIIALGLAVFANTMLPAYCE